MREFYGRLKTLLFRWTLGSDSVEDYEVEWWILKAIGTSLGLWDFRLSVSPAASRGLWGEQIKSGAKNQKNKDIISSASVSTQRFSPFFVTKLSLSNFAWPDRRHLWWAWEAPIFLFARATHLFNYLSRRSRLLANHVDIVLMRCSQPRDVPMRVHESLNRNTHHYL